MSWRDFFYFSKGERNALILLLCLIVIAGTLLVLTDSPSSQPTTTTPISQETIPDSSAQKTESPFTSQKPQPTPAKGLTKPKEKTTERIKRLTSSYPTYPRTEKLAPGTVVELNSADTTMLKKIPGIGSSFANRIVKYRNLLGGFYSVSQLGEVYGIDEEKYEAIAPWFTVDASLIQKLLVNTLPQDSLRKHPYISYQQAKAICQLRKQKKRLAGWENLTLLNEFTENDQHRIAPYLSFE